MANFDSSRVGRYYEMRSLGWLPVKGSYWSMLYGGRALQVALKRGFLKYLFTVWRRKPTAEAAA